MSSLDTPVAPADEFSHVIPPTHIVDRTSALKKFVAGRRTIHIGFVDEGRMQDRLDRDEWLHSQLAAVTADLVGLDRDGAGVAAARAMGFAAHVADCQDKDALAGLGIQPAEVIVAGELIEHLDQPGRFLEAIKQLLTPDGVLVITTPNAARIINVLGSLANREFVNDDHVCWFSWHTLSALLDRHDWRLDNLAYYVTPLRRSNRNWSTSVRAQVRAANLVRRAISLVARARPAIADGLVVTARLHTNPR